jgi:hypothetical protein
MHEYAVAQFIIADRLREANHQRLARELQRRERPSTARPATMEPQRPPWRWTLTHFHFHFHRAYN